MPRKKYNQPYPTAGDIYMNWLDVKQAAEIMDISGAAVRLACKDRRIRSKKFGSERRGEWRIDPVAARHYEKRKYPKLK